ncbi:MAG: nucleotidyltransferase family protein [Candidatus Omnitrophica bacterium]|nr:nucleotidyltransferase family protein [Candidatus Omnitrophota bacterium]
MRSSAGPSARYSKESPSTNTMQKIVKGESMLPFIRALDVCVSKRAEARLIKKGDIIIYEKAGDRVVHRVIAVDIPNGSVVVKGDNLPLGTQESVSFSKVEEKVILVKKGSRSVNLENRRNRTLGWIMAFLSSRDLTPGPLKQKMLDPLIYSVSRFPAYQILRRILYGKVSFTLGKQDDKRVLYAFVGRAKSAMAEISPGDGRTIFVNCRIRLRDRNRSFEEIFLSKVKETVLSEFGPDKDLKVKFRTKKENGPLSGDMCVRLYPAFCQEELLFDNEMRFVILCSRVNIPEKALEEVRRLGAVEGFYWDKVLELSDIYRTGPFLYGHIQRSGIAVPERAKTELRRMSGRVLAVNARAEEEILFLAAVFEEAGIEPIFIKGAAFLGEIYKTLGLRDLSDIDVLVKEKDFVRASRILEERGFHFQDQTGTREGYRTQRLYEKEGHIPVDLHSGFTGRKVHDRMMGIDREEVWRTRREIYLKGGRIYTLDLEHTVIYACLHLAAQHSFGGLIWYVDLNEVISRYAREMDWKRVITLAAKYRVKRPLYHALSFVENLMDAPVPPEVLKNLKHVRRRMDVWVFQKIKHSKRRTDYLAELAMFDTVLDTVKFAALNLVRYPVLLPHFASVFLNAAKGVTPSADKTYGAWWDNGKSRDESFDKRTQQDE